MMPTDLYAHARRLLLLALAGAALLLVAGNTGAQTPDPTPIVIGVTPTPTAEGVLAPDRFEYNDTPAAATAIAPGTQAGLTLLGADVDAFTVYLKAGQIVQASTTVDGPLDTVLRLLWQGEVLAENDDRSPIDLGSTLTFTAPADGDYVLLVEKAAGTTHDGAYDLGIAFVAPTATPTPLPTATPAPTATPSPSPTPLFEPDAAEPNDTAGSARALTPGLQGAYTVGGGDVDFFTFLAKAGTRYTCATVTNQADTLLTVHGPAGVVGTSDDRGVGRIDSALSWDNDTEQQVLVEVRARGGTFGPYQLLCQAAPVAPAPPPAAVPPAASSGAAATGTPPPVAPITTTASLTETNPISLTVRHAGRALPAAEAPLTRIRLLVYYDANNDRTPGPREGIAGVSVLAVDAQGQRLARTFTNTQGEAIFNLTEETVARVIVPFVPAWSARVRVGEANDDIVLGLPAVRLPVFFPVQPPVQEGR